MIQHKKVADVLVFNEAGELALQLRAAHDDSFPSHWDFSAGGGVDQGEDEMESAKRELKEELGIESEVKLVANKKYTYQAWDPAITREADVWIYRATHNGPFRPDPSEVEEARFFSLAALEDMFATKAKFHPEFVLAWEDGLVLKASKP